jgi:hypothetical protein
VALVRPRASGGYEPDLNEQAELTELWHLSRTALAGTGFDDREHRLRWAVDAFMKEHVGRAHVAYKWLWVWAADNLGVIVRRDD